MPTFVTGPVTVSVPATSANLGPGFDAFGMALDHRDRVTGEVVPGGSLEITVSGEGEGQVPLDERHLVHRALVRGFEHMGVDVPAVRLHCDNVIPHGRGLGSSSAAIVGGVCLARSLVAGGSLLMDDEAVLALAAEIEGHPDNVAPALYGGFTVAYVDGGTSRAASVSVDPRITAVAFVPPDPVETTVARGLLPETVSHDDAAANAGRAALLVAAVGGRPELLLAATEDRLHQDYREPAMPETLRLVRALRAEGLPAVVSGAGPTVLVFTDATQLDVVAAWGPSGWTTLRLTVDRSGARVETTG
ncbi:MAG: homoserine kinase [Nocardioidaceae bacterium]